MEILTQNSIVCALRDGRARRERSRRKRSKDGWRREKTKRDRRYLACIGTRSRVGYARQRILHLSTSKGTFSAGLKAESWKTSDAARVSIDRDIRLLVGKTPTSYYGLFWALPTLWYYNYVVIDKSIRLPSCESPFWRAQCRAPSPPRASPAPVDGDHCPGAAVDVARRRGSGRWRIPPVLCCRLGWINTTIG